MSRGRDPLRWTLLLTLGGLVHPGCGRNCRTWDGPVPAGVYEVRLMGALPEHPPTMPDVTPNVEVTEDQQLILSYVDPATRTLVTARYRIVPRGH